MNRAILGLLCVLALPAGARANVRALRVGIDVNCPYGLAT